MKPKIIQFQVTNSGNYVLLDNGKIFSNVNGIGVWGELDWLEDIKDDMGRQSIGDL